MHNLSLSHRPLKTTNPKTIAQAIAQHLAVHQLYGRVAIVAQHPAAFLVSLQKAWQALQGEMAAQGSKHTATLQLMRTCTFTTRLPIEQTYAWVQIATIADFLRWPPQCTTLYVTCPIKRVDLHMVTAWMPAKYGEVILYKKISK